MQNPNENTPSADQLRLMVELENAKLTREREERASRGLFAASLAKAQAQMKNAAKDADNPFFKSKYADLASVRDACFDALTGNGIGTLQLTPVAAEKWVAVETRFVHTGGYEVSSTCILPVTKADAQGYGSAITYARRYGLSALAGVAPEDDDGNAAVGKGRAVAEEPALHALLDGEGRLTWPTQLAGKKPSEITKPQVEWCVAEVAKETKKGGPSSTAWAKRAMVFSEELAKRNTQ